MQALLRYDRPEEKITRSAQVAERHASEQRPAADAWLAAHHVEIVAAIVDLLAEAERFGLTGEDREWLDELVVEGQALVLRPATMVILGLAIAELRTAPMVLALDGPRPQSVHDALRRAEGLRRAFAECGA